MPWNGLAVNLSPYFDSDTKWPASKESVTQVQLVISHFEVRAAANVFSVRELGGVITWVIDSSNSPSVFTDAPRLCSFLVSSSLYRTLNNWLSSRNPENDTTTFLPLLLLFAVEAEVGAALVTTLLVPFSFPATRVTGVSVSDWENLAVKLADLANGSSDDPGVLLGTGLVGGGTCGAGTISDMR